MRTRTGIGNHKLHGGMRVAFCGDDGSTLGILQDKCKTHAFVWNVLCYSVANPCGTLTAVDMNAITHVVSEREFEYLRALLQQGQEFRLYDREQEQTRMF